MELKNWESSKENKKEASKCMYDGWDGENIHSKVVLKGLEWAQA